MQNQFCYLFFIAVIFSSCVNEKEEGVVVSDATLFELALNTSSFNFFRNNADTLPADQQSVHFSFVRVRFNPKARTAMDDSLTSLSAQEFPDESMIVKEVYDVKGGPLKRLSIMYKLKNAANNGNGWIWSEIEADGNPVISSGLKGSSCIGCHSSGTQSDLVRTFALH
jgi:hypothetical protein